MDLVRLACIRHAASVRPEPGSNSPSRSAERSSPEGSERSSDQKSRPRSRSGPTGTVLAPHRTRRRDAVVRHVLTKVLKGRLVRSLPIARSPALAFLASCLPLSRNAVPVVRGRRSERGRSQWFLWVLPRCASALWGEVRTYRSPRDESTRWVETPVTRPRRGGASCARDAAGGSGRVAGRPR